jgi:hypothetical protein
LIHSYDNLRVMRRRTAMTENKSSLVVVVTNPKPNRGQSNTRTWFFYSRGSDFKLRISPNRGSRPRVVHKEVAAA